MRDHLPRGRTGLSPVVMVGGCVGPKEKLIGPNLTIAIENGLARNKHFHALVIERNHAHL
jgi:hypothetical protein